MPLLLTLVVVGFLAASSTAQSATVQTEIRQQQTGIFDPTKDLSASNKPPDAHLPQPTQFEIALLRSQQAVREGRAPDPATRRPDGTPGTLLDALLPEKFTDNQKAKSRRQLAARWRFLGANIPFLQGPTLAALNASFYRYASVRPNATVDWRRTIYITPIQAQYDCSSCWAMAAADTVAMVTAIAENRTGVMPGVQHLCDCSGLGCCNGGWPEDAFAWMVTNTNVTTNNFYNYMALDGQTCAVGSNYPVSGKISGWERVPMWSQDALMKAVNMHPVLVYISASSKDFQNYASTPFGTSGFRVYDGLCLNEVNHALVVVGYNLNWNTPYWILKNSWLPSGWGDNGYMYIAMYDGPGKCGMMTVNPIYPLYYPDAPVDATVQQGTYPVILYSGYWWTWWSWYGNPCTGIINPCGAGTCFRDENNVARCWCPSPFVELVGVPTSKCLEPSPCTTPLFNPCGAGWCVDVGDGSYVCGCPTGFAVGSRTNGAPTCVRVAALNVQTRAYVAQYGDTCASIARSFRLNTTAFSRLNPFVQCSRRLVPGLVVALEASSTVICTQQYAIRPYDTCGTISYYMDQAGATFRSWLNPASYSSPPTLLRTPTSTSVVPYLSSFNWWSQSSLLALNPALNCSSLYNSQLVCVTSTNVNLTARPIVCGQTYTTEAGDTCFGIRTKYGLTREAFRGLNPGINCGFNGGGGFYSGVQVCVANATATVDVGCTQWYTVQQGDTCAQIWNAANMSQYQLLYINPGLQCQPPFLYVGLQLCIDSPLLDDIPDPSYLTYTVQPNDTWAMIQAQFTSKCQAWSITIERIARQNGINDTDWQNYDLSGRVLPLVIPCIYKLGAACGCVDSIPVCGANLVTYNSYCEARCNFATPVYNGECNNCQLACSGRYGMRPVPRSACAADFMCPWPQWPPPLSDAAAIFNAPSQLCKYRIATCIRICAIFNYVNNLGFTDTTCYNTCMACFSVPCSGPGPPVPMGGDPCPYCFSNGTTISGCLFRSRGMCNTDCSVFNQVWNPINP